MKTLIRLGGRASFEMSDGRVRRAPGSILYDETGQAWPKCSLLFVPFSRAGRQNRATNEVREGVAWRRRDARGGPAGHPAERPSGVDRGRPSDVDLLHALRREGRRLRAPLRRHRRHRPVAHDRGLAPERAAPNRLRARQRDPMRSGSRLLSVVEGDRLPVGPAQGLGVVAAGGAGGAELATA